MSNLSDDDINEVIGDGTCTHLPQVRMALEIREHRATASKERVREVVRGAFADEVGGSIGEYGTARIDRDGVERIATRVAAQLATAGASR